MSKENLELWSEAYKTDPAYTKNYKGPGGFQGTSISSLYPVQRATELFGPQGKGWGFEIVKEEFIPGGPMVSKETGEILGNEQTHSLFIKMWANYDGDRLESQGYGLTPHISQNKYGVTTDHEAQKKSLTDALKKAMVLWGVGADVYMGLHDDNEYVQYVEGQAAMDKADDMEAEAIKQREEYDGWKERNLSAVETATSVYELESLFKPAVRKAKLRKDDDYIKQMTKAATKRKEKLNADKEEAA